MTTFNPSIMSSEQFNRFYNEMNTLDNNKHELEIISQNNGYTLHVKEKPGFWSRLFRSLFSTPETVRVSNVALLYLCIYKENVKYFSEDENIVDFNNKVQSYFQQNSSIIERTVEFALSILLDLQSLAIEINNTNENNKNLFATQKSTKQENADLKAQLNNTKKIEEENADLKARLNNTKKIEEENAALKAKFKQIEEENAAKFKQMEEENEALKEQLGKTIQKLTHERQKNTVQIEVKKEEELTITPPKNSISVDVIQPDNELRYGLLDQIPTLRGFFY